MGKESLKNILLLFAGFALSAVFLTLIQVPFSISWLAWVALVPFILICSDKAKLWPLMILAYVVSVIYWLGNLYWIGMTTKAGWVAFCLYMGLYWPVLAMCVRWCRMKRLPLFVSVAVLFLGAEAFQGFFFNGFSWRLLGHSQYANITIIQIADVFGAGGVSFLVAMVNGFLAQMIISFRQKRLLRRDNVIALIVVAIAIVAAVFYGRWRVGQVDEFVRLGPIVAAVQTNVPFDVKESEVAEEGIFLDMLRKSRLCAGAGAELIVWPETMVLGTLNKSVLEMVSESHLYNVFDRALSRHSAEGVYVLAGASGGKAKVIDGKLRQVEKYNTAFLYRPDGKQDQKHYNKIHLVPFGEYVPLRNSIPPLHWLLMKLTPYEYDYTIDAGSEYTVFDMNSNGAEYKFSVIICYEDTVPKIARRMSLDENGKKRIDWLVNISNDGWFVAPGDNGRASTELAQHTAICVFRAVENRLAVLRSVNTGISCVIDSLGQIQNRFIIGTLPPEVAQRAGVGGWFMDRMPIDARVTFFSKFGQWLDFCCAICLIIAIILSVKCKGCKK